MEELMPLRFIELCVSVQVRLVVVSGDTGDTVHLEIRLFNNSKRTEERNAEWTHTLSKVQGLILTKQG